MKLIIILKSTLIAITITMAKETLIEKVIGTVIETVSGLNVLKLKVKVIKIVVWIIIVNNFYYYYYYYYFYWCNYYYYQ